MKGWMYILECVDGSYYTGSTIDLERRFLQHTNGEGANHTKNRLPVKLVYFEEYSRIDTAFYREKQVQRWRREKKEALIRGEFKKLPELASRTSERGVGVPGTRRQVAAGHLGGDVGVLMKFGLSTWERGLEHLGEG